jgi:hypothetical protein
MELLLTLGTTSLAGCALPLEKDQNGQTEPESEPPSSPTDTPTETGTPTEEPQPDTGFIDLQKPSDADDSPIYEMLTPAEDTENVIEYRRSIQDALQWKLDDLEHWAESDYTRPEFADIPEKIDDEEWIESQIE